MENWKREILGYKVGVEYKSPNSNPFYKIYWEEELKLIKVHFYMSNCISDVNERLSKMIKVRFKHEKREVLTTLANINESFLY